ncbi:MAG TPA: MMPL family transporter [Mycobacteriales bacterium]|nr:MMPL family transporter [Mycobacteriales bacterium]
MFGAIGRFCVRRRWLVLLGWVVLVAAGGLASGPVFAGLRTTQASDRLESVQAFHLISDNATYGGRVVGLVDDVPVADPQVRAAITAAARDVATQPHVGRVVDPYAVPGLVATDGRGAVVVVDLDRDLPRSDRDSAIDAASVRLRELTRQLPGASVKMGGDPLLDREINQQVAADTRQAEVVSLPITLIVMVVIFAGLLAALLPLIGAVAAIGGAFLCLLGFSAFLTLDPNTVPVTTLLGLGISIDYALLIVSRFREERGGGLSVPAAIERTTATAGRTIAFSALTVAVSLAALMVFDDPTFRAIGAAGSAVVVVALLAALTLVPALLSLVGGRISVARGTAPEHGFFSRLAGGVQRRAWPVAIGVAALLLVAGTPLLSLRLENGGGALLPDSFESVQVEQNLTVRFPGMGTSPVTVLARATPQQLDAYVAGLAGRVDRADVAGVGTASRLGGSAYSSVDITPTGTSQGDAATRLVHQLRADRPPFQSWVTGDAAVLIDFSGALWDRLPWAFGVIAIALFVLLFLMTGSVLVPLKALVMNTISLGATFGSLVWVFQQGHLEGLLGFTSPGAIETWVPVIVFAFAFGVSMDYEVFLLARIKELYDAGLRNDEAVRVGLQRSGRIITSAALLIVIVFCGFAAGRMLGIKEMGFALAVAVVVDATLVRCLLVPATMTLLGDLNWWAPGPLRRLHARIGVREGGVVPAPRRELETAGRHRAEGADDELRITADGTIARTRD